MLGTEGVPYTPPVTPPLPTQYGRAPKPPKPARQQRVPRTGGKFPVGTAVVALIVIAASAGALFAFSKAKVTITPMQKDIMMAGDMLATAGGGTLPFAVVSVEKVATAEVKSEGTENVQQAAQGSIVISNTQAVPQQLIKNTRFETPDGKIYRIRDSITVPASQGGPGTLTVTVYADATGESFNIPATTFTLPGLKGSKAFEQVTAKSEGPMTGGFSGVRPTVSQATKDKTYATLKQELTDGIDAAIQAKVPEGYVLLPGASFVTYVSEPDAPAAGGAVSLSQKASATAVVFPRQAIASAIAYANDGTYNGQAVTLKKESGLKVTAKTGAAPSATDQEFAFTLEGNASILWVVEGDRIAGAVAGKNRESAETALTGFPEVEKVHILIRPFWSSSFPSDPSKIEVVVLEPSSKT